MIRNDEIDPRAACAFGCREGPCPGVHADDEANTSCSGALNHIAAEIVTFANTMRNMDVSLTTAEFDRGLQDDHGGGSIHVVIAVDENAFFALDGGIEAIDRGVH